MASRAYNNETRLLQQAELKARITAATAGLHAEKGVVSTTYADIAQRAGVSLPTVYKHFPQFDGLVTACTGHVAQAAPPLPVEQIMATHGLDEAASTLVDAMDRIHAYLEPWMVWREHGLVSVLGQQRAQRRQQLTGFISQLLARQLGAGDHGAAAALWESILQFELWHRLVRDHKLPRTAVRRHLVQLLLAVAGPQPAGKSSSRPTRRKSP
jgi:AcrR family transcriptional regulator